MKKLLILLLSALAISPCLGLEITPEHVIVTVQDSYEPEQKSAEILNSYLEKIFGRKLAVVREDAFPNDRPAIYMGNTRFANAIGVKSSAADEHVIMVRNNNLIITGDRPRGTLFGVYEFLEKFGGCWKLAVDAEYVPRRETISVPDGKVFRGHPFFAARMLYMYNDVCDDCAFLRSWYRTNVSSCYPPGGKPRNYLYYSLRRDGGGHTFESYAKAIPANRSDCFSLVNGKRTRGPGAQLCLSNPDTRKFVCQELKRRIDHNRKMTEAGREILNSWYDISANDTVHGNCSCADCLALEKKYGSYSAVLFAFINDIAAAFPKETIQTFAAYGNTEKLPENISFRRNVMPNLAPQCTCFINTRNDLLSPFDHPNNANLVQQLNRWFSLGSKFAVFDYGRLHAQAIPTPFLLTHTLQSKFRYYADTRKVWSYCVEIEPCDLNLLTVPPAFFDLQLFLTAKLMYNPYLDVEPLRKQYMEIYYGKAAGFMEQYYQLLLNAQNSSPVPAPSVPPAKRQYLTPEFFRSADQILTRAENAVRGLPEYQWRIGQERIGLDFACLRLGNLFKWQMETYPISRTGMIDRLERNLLHAADKYYGKHPSHAKVLHKAKEEISKLRNPIPVPPGFEQKSILQFSALDSIQSATAVEDSDALFGKALRVGKNKFGHSRPMEIGVWCDDSGTYALRKLFSPAEYRQDGKYHLYYAGRMRTPAVPAKTVMYFHCGWDLRLTSILRNAVSSGDPNTEYDVYVSIKLEGPAYVRNSRKENSVSVDRVVFVQR